MGLYAQSLCLHICPIVADWRQVIKEVYHERDLPADL